jgi:uncharacterized Zn-binding protein involved in type VI secretion
VGKLLPPAAPTVLINGKPASRIADPAFCLRDNCIATGATTVLIEKMMAARKDELTIHNGTVITGAENVLIGGPSAGPGGLPVSVDALGNINIGNSITIKGDSEFQAKAFQRLATVGSTESGKTVLQNIDASGKSVTIIEYERQNSYAGPDDYADATPAGQPVFNGQGDPVLDWRGNQKIGTGEGTDVTLKYNPDLRLNNPQDPLNPPPADSVLFHELSHADHETNGEYTGTPDAGYTTQDERRVITTEPPTEADYLRERGYPWQRDGHGEHWIPNP